MSLQRVHATLVDAPFEQKPAVLRSVQGMGTFASLDQSLSRADEHFEKTYMSLNDASTEAGPSHRPDITLDSEPNGVNGLAATASGDMLRTLESSSLGGVLRSALTMGPVDAGEASGNNGTMTRNTSANGSAVMQGKQRENERVPYPLELQESLDDVVGSDFQLGAWWNSTTSSNLLASGISSLSTSVQIEPISKRSIGEASRKKRRKRKGDMPSHVFGGVEALERNVSTISKLRRTHTKFGALASHIENEEPIPAALAVVSSDESDNEDASRRGTAEKEPELRTRKRYKEVDMCAPSMHDPFRNPYAKLSSEGATEILESKTQFLLAHAGFEGVQRAAIDVITDVASEYIMSIGRTLRMYTDQFAHEMSVEEIILHAIFENGGMDIRSLESYIVDDVLRYGSKMSDLLRKLQASYRETLSSTNLTMEDEAYFAENAEGNNDQIMSGTFAQDMGDDFFGFKEMGLDKELGLDMSQLVVPSKLFDRGKNARGSNGRHVGAVARSGAAASNGVIGGPAEVILFEPPPPYVPLSEAAISAQIGLLQPFYRDLIRSRGQWQHRSNRRRDDSGEGEGDDEAEAEVEEAEVKEGVDEEGRRSTSNRSILILPDEEMERQRYKVPPNGKMPKRAMKSKGDYKLTSSKKDAASTTASTTTKTTSKSSSSKKKKKVD
jgi:transcriptional activator SPT7